jgi:UDP-3-O-acyl N-acetylglucosamine deacetylase
VEYRIEAQRRTVLKCSGVRVAMVEHVLAALAGLGVDNCEVHVSAEEMPGLEGSSKTFVEAIEQAGIVEMDVPRRVLEVHETIHLEDGPAWIEARPCSSRTGMFSNNQTAQPSFSIEYHLDYGEDGPIGRQSIDLEITPDSFRQELAPARTFMFKHEAEWLVSQGLGTRVTSRDLLVFDQEGPIENILRFDNECVRHKALDVVGDLALAGCDLLGHIVAYRSGHRLNAELVQAIQEQAAFYQTQFEEPSGRALSA